MVRSDFYSDSFEEEAAKIVDGVLSEKKGQQIDVLLREYSEPYPYETIRCVSLIGLCEKTGWSLSTVRKYNKKLLALGLVEASPSDSPQKYRISQKGLKFIKRFCPHCLNGRLVVKKENKHKNSLKCSSCGYENYEEFCVNCGTLRPWDGEKGHYICGTTKIQKFLLVMNKELAGWVCSEECQEKLAEQFIPKTKKPGLEEGKLTRVSKELLAIRTGNIIRIWPLPLEGIEKKGACELKIG